MGGATTPRLHAICFVENVCNVRAKLRCVPKAAQCKPVLLPRPIHVAGRQFRPGLAREHPRTLCQLPCPDMFRRVQPNQGVGPANRLRQKTLTTLKYPRICLKRLSQSGNCFRTGTLLPIGQELQCIQGDHRSIWSHQGQFSSKSAFARTICSRDDKSLQSIPAVSMRTHKAYQLCFIAPRSAKPTRQCLVHCAANGGSEPKPPRCRTSHQ